MSVTIVKDHGSSAWYCRYNGEQFKKSCKKCKTEQDFREFVLSESATKSATKKENIEKLGTQSKTSESIGAVGDTGNIISPDNDDMDSTNQQKIPVDSVSVTTKLDIQSLPTKTKSIPAALLKSVKVKPNKLNKPNPSKFVKKSALDNSILDSFFGDPEYE
jgi:hypothetical protein